MAVPPYSHAVLVLSHAFGSRRCRTPLYNPGKADQTAPIRRRHLSPPFFGDHGIVHLPNDSLVFSAAHVGDPSWRALGLCDARQILGMGFDRDLFLDYVDDLRHL